MSSKLTLSPFFVSSSYRLCARTSGEAVTNIFNSASGNTVVPMSLPSITMPFCFPISRCCVVRHSRTNGSAATRLTFCETSSVRISLSTFLPLRCVITPPVSGLIVNVIFISGMRFSSSDVSMPFGETRLFSKQNRVTARYMAPVSIYI